MHQTDLPGAFDVLADVIVRKRMETIIPGDTFDVGTRVKREGCYICVPCGYRCRFAFGDIFPRCFGCLEGEANRENEEFLKDLGLWEYLS